MKQNAILYVGCTAYRCGVIIIGYYVFFVTIRCKSTTIVWIVQISIVNPNALIKNEPYGSSVAGEVKRKTGMRSALSIRSERTPVGWARIP